jgi:CheY-like chemotaxis protein/HPt (histidine-containing phosphotransfer) domain-containing protein
VNQVVARGLLEKRGHEVTMVDNGKEAVAAVESGSFDVVLMDVQMPEMNGMEATAAIRAREKKEGGHIPIIAMTANAMEGDEADCLEGGMDDYIPKPVQPERLYETLEQFAHDGGVDARKGRVSVTSDPSVSAPPGAEVFDAERFRNNTGDAALMAELIGFFEEDAVEMLQAIGEAESAGDGEKLHRAAHSLKGLIGNYCANRAYHEAVELDLAARKGDLEAVRQRFPSVKSEVGRLGEVLQAFRETLKPS